jgi:SAM-dependent methyltransferase
MPTDWLKMREQHNPGRVMFDLEVMENNFVWTPGSDLSSCTESRYDYVVSSHVVEHVPDFLGHMIEISKILNEGGSYVFVIPNGRGTGEYFRRISEESDVIEHFFRGGNSTSPGQNWDYLRRIIKYDGTKMEGFKFENFVRHHTDAEAIQDSIRCFQEYVDVHCWVFDRVGFLSLVTALNTLNLFPFRVFNFMESSHRTKDDQPVEFIIHLKKIDYQIPESWQKYIKSRKIFSWYSTESKAPGKEMEEFKDTESQIQDLENQNRNLISDLNNKSNELSMILNSKSWKLTSFFRRIRKMMTT